MSVLILFLLFSPSTDRPCEAHSELTPAQGYPIVIDSDMHAKDDLLPGKASRALPPETSAEVIVATVVRLRHLTEPTLQYSPAQFLVVIILLFLSHDAPKTKRHKLSNLRISENTSLLLAVAVVIATSIMPATAFTEFSKTYGGSREESGGYITTTSAGDYYYLAGTTKSQGNTDGEFWILKLALDGTVAWTTYIACAQRSGANTIAATTDDGCIVGGMVRQDCSSILLEDESYVVLVAPDGSIKWEVQLNKWSFCSPVRGIVALKDGSGYIVVGSACGLGSYVARLDNNGNTVNGVTKGILNYNVRAVTQLSNGNVAITGHYYNLLSCWKCLYWVYNTGLLKQYDTDYGSTGDDECYGMTELSDGNVALVGSKKGAGGYDVWLLKVKPDGTLLWEKTFDTSGDDNGVVVRESAVGRLIIGGYTNGKGYGRIDFWIIKTTSDGTKLNDWTIGTADNDQLYGMLYTAENLTVAAGSTGSNNGDLYVVAKWLGYPVGTYMDSTTEACIVCSKGYYQNLTSQSSCLKCWKGSYQDEEGSTSCKVCPVGTYQPDLGATSYVDCPAGEYQNLTEQSACVSCSPGTVQNLTGKTSCVDCDPGYFQGDYGQTTCTICPAGTYQNLTGQAECPQCWKGSYQDLPGKTGCILCAPGTYQSMPGTTGCPKCGYEQYQDESGQTGCKICTGGRYMNVTGGVGCLLCPERYYYGYTERLCEPCMSSCSSCPSETTCSVCDEGYVKKRQSDGTDICALCASDKFINSAAECQACNTYCAQCTGSAASDCVAGMCRNGAYPLEGLETTCVPNCYSRYGSIYLDAEAGVCRHVSCHASCLTCFGPTSKECRECRDKSKLLYEGECLDACPEGYFAGDSNICFSCDADCVKCIGVGKCSKCASGLLMCDGWCRSSCPSGYYQVSALNLTCVSCSAATPGCKACSSSGESRGKCVACGEGYVLYNGSQCVAQCPDGTYSTGEKCAVCASACRTCTGGTYRSCLACADGYIKYSESTCVQPSCIYGTFYNATTKKCQGCPDDCKVCYNAEECATCSSGYRLGTDGKCYDPCRNASAGLIRDSTTGKCTEVCGDGKNLGIYECDDGNKKSGDGCSSNCKVENYYVCSGGSATSMDTCVYRKPPDNSGTILRKSFCFCKVRCLSSPLRIPRESVLLLREGPTGDSGEMGTHAV